MELSDITVDLLGLGELPPPLGGLGLSTRWGVTRSLWASPLPGECSPRPRIIHNRTLRLHRPTPLQRLGIRPAPGYHKCGSQFRFDRVTSVRLLAWREKGWHVLRTSAA